MSVEIAKKVEGNILGNSGGGQSSGCEKSDGSGKLKVIHVLMR